MKAVIFKLLAASAVLSACAAPVQPFTPAEIQNAVYWRQMAHTCVAKGYVSDVASMSTYINLWDVALSSRANSQQVNAAIQANYRAHDWQNIDISHCRTLELTSIRQANEEAIRQRQNEQANMVMGSYTVQPYQPMYTSCYSATGMCVSY